MIKIKFRAWDKERSQMHYVDQIHFGHGGAPTVTTWVQDFRGSQRLLVFGENAELMQFTGLKDKNGKEIWEGDILGPMENDHRPQYEGNWIVEFGEGCFRARPNNGLQEVWIPYWMPDKQIEVLGNIYENPELLS